ncbi:quinone oxidoreductase family protein [Actinotalea subterranea]|uniref:quinone oxidoreductase family protein n=1 Tax=Actinotalea subterranea TaxID=2607497 RepID=UPI0011ED0BB9|nr:NADP-dependent oxidoreductase [Actinotalea subterranea]
MARAVVATAYGDPGVLALVDVRNGSPGPGQVLLEVRAAGVNPSDWKSYSGAWGTDPGKLPLRLGHEASGVVLAVGPDVEGVEPGDEVIAYPVTGAYADRVLVRATSLLPKPAGLSWEKAAGLMVAGVTAAHTLEATRVGAGDTVLVHGASGGVGAMVVQLAHAKGARVIGTAGPVNHEYVSDLHAVPVAYGPGLADRVRAAAPGGVSAAIDTAGTDEALDTSATLVTDRHRIATIAGFRRGAQLGVHLLGGGEGADPGKDVRMKARAALVRHWENGHLDVRVGATYHLADVARAHRAGIDGKVQGKIILKP